MSSCFSYINIRDRDGLLYPTDYLVAVVSEGYKVFQWIIDSKDQETKFLSLKNQRRAVAVLRL